MEKLIHCHDGCLVPMIAKQKSNGDWDIFGISKVFGMGSGEYNNNIFDFEISDLILLNSLKGVSYICIKKEQSWGLVEVRNNKTIECEWEIISEFKHPTVEKMLSDLDIKKDDVLL